jgi:hypothetical protein
MTPPGPHSIDHRRATVQDLAVQGLAVQGLEVQDLEVQGPRERIDDVFRRQRVSAPFETIF